MALGVLLTVLAGPGAEWDSLLAQGLPPSTPARENIYSGGRLVAVDCSVQPSAVLTMTSGGKTWKLNARDATRVIVIGADKFSCGWANQRISVNYHETGESTGELISVEVQ